MIYLREVSLWLPKLLAALVIIFFSVALAKILKKAVIRSSSAFNLDKNITILLVRIVFILLVLMGAITALGTLGVDVSALVAGLGLTGFALGFALKDMVSNFLSGILILLYKPFEIGNHIKVAGYEGKVTSVDFRYTQLSSDSKKILIPNSKLFTDPVTVMDGSSD